MSDLERIGRLLPALPAGRRPHPGATAARAAWAEAVGADVARHSHPMRVTGETLVVHCSSSTWASELSLLGPHILERLRAALGDGAPAALRFEVGELPAPPPSPEAAAARPAIHPAAAARARALAGELSDERLREALERAIGAASGTQT
jgi:hypothetical protein